MESAGRRPWKLVAGLVLLAACYWVAMFVATHLPIRTTPVGDPYSLDKLEHLTAFAALAALLNVVAAAIGFRSWKVSVAIICFIGLYALVDESTQVSPRSPEVLDWLADICGAALGTALYLSVARFRAATWLARRPAE
jgi:VanZ family protein